MSIRFRAPALFLLACLAWATAWPGAVKAGEADRPLGVVELFTSQGCSSCPPADAVLGELVAEGRVLALSYHVDYWNYLGWKDTLASPENTARQHAYARAQERKSVYTPQAIINGRVHENGSERTAIDRHLDAMAAKGEGLHVDVGIEHAGDTVTIDVKAGTGKANLVLVVFERHNRVAVASGENDGRSIDYHNSVRAIQTVGMWKGKPLTVELPASIVDDWARKNCAVLLQRAAGRGVPGPIIGAAVIRD
jgi:hypothetical protein